MGANPEREAGRNPAELGMAGRIPLRRCPRSEWLEQADAWKRMGAGQLWVNTMGMGLETPRDHMDAIREFKAVVDGRREDTGR